MGDININCGCGSGSKKPSTKRKPRKSQLDRFYEADAKLAKLIGGRR